LTKNTQIRGPRTTLQNTTNNKGLIKFDQWWNWKKSKYLNLIWVKNKDLKNKDQN
jgi:hypothetical protein